MVVSIDGFGQRKKKNPYEGYWEQQEKQEQFDKIAKEALVLFQAKKYENAKNKYSAALKIIPTDQRVIAKIRDIDLLIEKQKHAQMQQQSFTPEHTIEESKEEEEEEEEEPLLDLSDPKNPTNYITKMAGLIISANSQSSSSSSSHLLLFLAD